MRYALATCAAALHAVRMMSKTGLSNEVLDAIVQAMFEKARRRVRR
jgi:hypothetical protein